MTEVSDRRVAVVTGAARGIGEAAAARLLAGGWDVALVDISAAVAETAERLTGSTSRAIGIRADVSAAPDIAEIAATVEREFGRLDAVIANVAVGGPSTPLLETPNEAIRTVLDINLYGALEVVRALVPLMQRSTDSGRVVFIGSLFAQQPVRGAAPYIISKDAISGLMHTLAIELAPSVTVNSVSPGYIMTEMHREELVARGERAGTTWEEQAALVRASIPLGRHGQSEDVAAAIAFLVSPDAAYITGQTLNVNGGAYLS